MYEIIRRMTQFLERGLVRFVTIRKYTSGVFVIRGKN